jgi:type IV secretion system protein VirB6
MSSEDLVAEQKKNAIKLKIIKITLIVACVILSIIAIIGMIISIFMGSMDLCTIRTLKPSSEIIDPSIYKEKSLLASGKYSQNSSYGSWLNTEIETEKDLFVEVSGSVSLCMGYITKNNLYQDSELDNENKMIQIPRVSDSGLGIPIRLDTKDYWRNVFHVLDQDIVTITMAENTTSSSYKIYDIFSQSSKILDCSSEKIDLPSGCGRYSPFYGIKYALEYSCEYTGKKEDFCDCSGYDASIPDPDISTWEVCRSSCKNRIIKNTCYCRNTGFGCGPCTCQAACRDKYQSIKYSWKSLKDDNILLPYSKETTAPFFNNTNKSDMDFIKNIKTSPVTECENTNRKKSQSNEPIPQSKKTEKADYPFEKKWLWFKANDKTGLIYRFSASSDKESNLGTKYTFFDKSSSNTKEFKINSALTGIDKSGYLQLRLYKPNGSIDSTGGYLLYLKQTKCYRENGRAISDTHQNRGQILYIKSTSSEPTTQETNQAKPLVFYKNNELNGNPIYKITGESSGKKGKLFLKINNNKDDYKDSDGAYKLTIYDNSDNKTDILGLGDLIADGIKRNFSYGIDIFKKMTCYKSIDKKSCFDLFLYIKVVLILYVMSMGALIAIGYMDINSYELINRVIKIIFISGLMSEYTFDFFSETVFPIVVYGPMQIIGEINGYNIPNPSDSIRYYFKPASLIFSETIISGMFWQHALSLLVSGIFGPIVLILVILATIDVLISALKFVVIGFMCSVGNSVIIGTAPIFLSFMLFEKTQYLFDSWLKSLVRFFIEIIVVGFGLTVFINLFLIFLDQITAYSVCFKCALPLFIPILGIEIDLLCLNWFLPWGLELGDMKSIPTLGMSMALFIISSLSRNYLEVADNITSRLSSTGSIGGYALYSAVFSKNGLKSVTKLLKDTNVTNVAKKTGKGLKYTASLYKSENRRKLGADVSKKLDDTKKYAMVTYETSKYAIKNPGKTSKKLSNYKLKNIAKEAFKQMKSKDSDDSGD